MPVASAVRSSRDRTTVRPGAGAMGSSDGTANTRQPAASADATPLGESSRAKQSHGDTPTSLAASRYGSGSGLVAVTSSAHTSTSNRSPVLTRTASMKLRSDEVTKARGSPAAATAVSNSRAPGRNGTPSRRTRSAMSAMSHSPMASAGAGSAALASRYRTVRSRLPPSSAAWSASVQPEPSRAMTERSAASHSGSESISNPSMSNSTAVPTAVEQSDTEVLRLGVVHDDRVGGLLGMQLHLLGQLDTDPGRLEQAHHLGAVGQVRAGGVAEGVARPPVVDPEEAIQLVGIGAADAEFTPDPGVPVLSQRLGELNGQAVQLQVLAVGVLGEQLGRDRGDPQAHGGELERHHIGLGRIRGLEEVGQAQPPVAPLPGEGEPLELGDPVLVQHDQVVSLAGAAEVAVDHRRLEQPLGLHSL